MLYAVLFTLGVLAPPFLQHAPWPLEKANDFLGEYDSLLSHDPLLLYFHPNEVVVFRSIIASIAV